MAGVEQRAGKSQGVVNKGLETWNTFNKVTLTAELAVALFVPALAVPALALAAVDGAQIVIINKIKEKNTKKESNQMKQTTVFDAKAHAQNVKKNQLALAA